MADRDLHEGVHRPGPLPRWSESWYFDFASPGGDLGGYVRLALLPNDGVAWYWASLVGPDRPLVSVIDLEVPLPSRAGSLEVRTEGLWADHIVETPFDHVTLGAEAFAVSVDDPAEVYAGELRGDRVPFGLDLEWETDGGVAVSPGRSGYEVPCRVHGEILVGNEAIDFDGVGHRNHGWGTADWWSLGWCWTAGRLDDGTRFQGSDLRMPVLEYTAGFVAAAGEEPRPLDRPMVVSERLGEADLPVRAELQLDELSLVVEPLAWSPVLLVADDGRQSRLPRSLTRFVSADGRTGVGWTEWNQPGPQD